MQKIEMSGMKNPSHQKLVFKGDDPEARFGHTVTMISENKAILFGGATGNTGKFSITGDTYLCDLVTLTWTKLNRKPLIY